MSGSHMMYNLVENLHVIHGDSTDRIIKDVSNSWL